MDYKKEYERWLTEVSDTELLDEVVREHDVIVVMEENITAGGYFEKLTSAYATGGRIRPDMKFINASVTESVVAQGSIEEQRSRLGIDAAHVYERIMEAVKA